MVNCPLCEAEIDVDEDELDEGDSLLCEECATELTVTGLSPLELSTDGSSDDEDFDDEDDDFDDEEEDDDEDLGDYGSDEEEEDEVF